MYTDSDDDDRETGLDFQFGNHSPGYPAPDINPNSHYDQSFDLSDSSNDSDKYTPGMGKSPAVGSGAPAAQSPSRKPRYDEDDDDFGLDNGGRYSPRANRSNTPDEDFGEKSEMASLFGLIAKFQPEPVEISVHWKPFVPELVPAIGTIDAFIKVPRPDGELDDLGLVIIDEPSIAQSNPQVLRMELREKYGVVSPGNESDGYVGSIEDPVKNYKALESWLESIEEIHRNRPPPTVIYTSKMPEFEDLMEPWPESFEEVLKSLPLPTSEIDLTLEEYARMVLALLEIPVSGNIIESLHHMFTLYAQFEGNYYFKSQEQQ